MKHIHTNSISVKRRATMKQTKADKLFHELDFDVNYYEALVENEFESGFSVRGHDRHGLMVEIDFDITHKEVTVHQEGCTYKSPDFANEINIAIIEKASELGFPGYDRVLDK